MRTLRRYQIARGDDALRLKCTGSDHFERDVASTSRESGGTTRFHLCTPEYFRSILRSTIESRMQDPDFMITFTLQGGGSYVDARSKGFKEIDGQIFMQVERFNSIEFGVDIEIIDMFQFIS